MFGIKYFFDILLIINYRYKTIGNQQELSIVFMMNYTVNENPFTQSWGYISELISNDYPKGFKSYLINNGLINSLDAGFEVGNFDFFMYIVKFDLTSDGFKVIPDIINNFFALIGFISDQGVSQSIYNEKSLISYLNFLYQQKENLDDELLDLLQKMGIDLKYIYVRSSVYMNYDENIIKFWLSQMQPSNALFVMGSNDFQINEQVEKIVFKKKKDSFKEKIEKTWEIYDDFFEEITDNPAKSNTYHLKEIQKNEKNETNSNLKNESKLIHMFKKKLQKSKIPQYFSHQKHHCKVSKHVKKLNHLNQIQQNSNDNNSFVSWMYSEKLNKEEEIMKVFYRVEPINSSEISKMSSYIADYKQILPQEIELYESNNFIPNDVSIIDDKCKIANTNNVSKSLLYKQNLLSIQNFTDPIDDLLKKNFNQQNIAINSTCFQSELENDRKFNNPNLILGQNNMEIWHKSSREFNLPYVKVYLELFYPNCGFESFMLDMLNAKLNIDLSDELVKPSMLGYNIEVSKDSIGLKVNFKGFQNKLQDLGDIFNEKLENLTINENDFTGIKMMYLLQDLFGGSAQNQPTDEVLQQAELILKTALEINENENTFEKYLKNSDYDTFLKSIDDFKKRTKIKGLFFGNILESNAKTFMDNFTKNFGLSDTNSYNSSCTFENKAKVLKIPKDISLVYRTTNLNSDDLNHAIINYYQWGIKDVPSILKLKAFSTIFNTKAFDYLRTSNQLGYIVFAEPLLNNDVIGVGVFIQGSKHNPLEMDGFIEDFLKAFEDYFSDLDEEFFQNEINNIFYQTFEKRNKEFSTKGDSYWKEISEGSYDFEKNEIKKALQQLTKHDIIDFYRDLVKNSQRKLSIQVWGGNLDVSNETLSEDRDFAGIKQKIISDFKDLESYEIRDKKLNFFSKI